MAVYGRKRVKILVTPPDRLFSDDEETDLANEGPIPIVKDARTAHPRDISYQSPDRPKSRTPPDVDDDRLTQSPRKLSKFINSIDPSVSKQDFSPKRDLYQQLKHLQLLPTTPKRPATNKRTLVSPAKVGPREQNAWDDLFSNIDNNSSKPSLVEDLLASDTQSDSEIGVNLMDKFLAFESEVTDSLNQEQKLPTVSALRLVTAKRTYGAAERSFLEDSKDENGIAETYIDTEVSNINDLRTSGENSKLRDEIEYICDGLVLRGNDELKNGLLISTLINLAHSIETNDNIANNAAVLIQRLAIISNKLTKLTTNGKKIVEWLIGVVLLLFLEVVGSEKVSPLLPPLHLNMSHDEFSTDKLLKLTASDLDKLRHKYSPHYVQLRFLSLQKEAPAFQTWSNIQFAAKLYPQVDTEAETEILLFYQHYLESFLTVEDVTLFMKPIAATVNQTALLAPINLQALKVLVLLSTNYQHPAIVEKIFIASYVSKLLPVLNRTFELIKQGTSDDLYINASLFILGYLINYAEQDSSTLDPNISDNIRQLEGIETNEEAVRHLVGYNAIYLAYLKTNHNLAIDNKTLTGLLEDFVAIIDIEVVRNKIHRLILQLN